MKERKRIYLCLDLIAYGVRLVLRRAPYGSPCTSNLSIKTRQLTSTA